MILSVKGQYKPIGGEKVGTIVAIINDGHVVQFETDGCTYSLEYGKFCEYFERVEIAPPAPLKDA